MFAAVRAALFVLALVPFAELVRLGFTGGLGANPVEFVLRWLGTWTLVALLATLSITPLRWMTGWAWLIRLRRMLGLYAFFYGTLHVTSYVWIDHFFDWAQIVDDIAKRPYLTFGFVAYVLMIPLAITSTNAMVRRLGGRNWQRLHRMRVPGRGARGAALLVSQARQDCEHRVLPPGKYLPRPLTERGA